MDGLVIIDIHNSGYTFAGVKLWKLEQRPNVGTMLLKLDFQTDVVPRLLFLKELGVEDSGLAYILSDNPFILKEDLENLQARLGKKNNLVNVYAVYISQEYQTHYIKRRFVDRALMYMHRTCTM